MPTTTPIPAAAPIPRLRRAIASVVALSIVATVLATLVARPADAAAANNFWFRDGTEQKVFGPNSTVMIDGVLRYDDQCRYDTAVKDFFYPATDVYVVPAGSVTAPDQYLTDIGGTGPNTIVGVGDGAFLGETLGFTAPAGTIPTGSFDLVFDTCQDGFFDPVGDDVFPNAVTVELPEVLPPVSPSIAALKEAARVNAVEWLRFHALFQAVLNIDKAKEVAACMIFPNPICLMKVLAVIFDEAHIGNRQGGNITDLAPQLVMNVAKGHYAIWKDPADPDFDVLPVLERPEDGELPSSGQPLADALAGLLPALADEAALTDGLLHALERYQGAQQAGDGDWALVQARAAADLSAVLADHLSGSDALTALRDAVAADGELTARLAEGAAFANRVRTRGFETAEIRSLRNQGLDTADIVDLERGFVEDGHLPSYSSTDLVEQLDRLLDARTDAVEALDASAAGWTAVAEDLDGPGRAHPTADAGGPYATGAALTLDGTGSTATAGATLTDHEWDLDADGEFDDATGASPTVDAPDQAGLVSLRVTDDAGRQAVAHAVLAGGSGDRTPVVTGKAPATASNVVVGDDVTFSVEASDPEGADLAYAWSLDATAVGSSSDSFTWTPGVGDVGTHTLTVTVDDGTTRGTVSAWRVTVTPPDADGDGWSSNVDCDDARADRSPSNVERLGNELDDDCNPSTPDAPPGGLAGALWSWGHHDGVGTGTTTNRLSPGPVPGLTDVVQVESKRATGYAVLGSGQVRAWGQNHRGELGDGTGLPSRTPVVVAGIRGESVLSNVVQVAADTMHAVALLGDGSVVAWGDNALGQAGNGSATFSHDAPVQVTTADGEPLSGVVAVETGVSEAYALLDDGSVAGWGTARCAGTSSSGQNRSATPMPLFGDDVVQVVAAGLVLARNADGSVWSCGGDTELLGRGKSLTNEQRATPAPMHAFGPGTDVIDVSAGARAGIALQADGTVWLWGQNNNGILDALGVPRDTYATTPLRLPLPPGAPVVDVELDDSCRGLAVRADGSVLSWGCNTNGAAGAGTTADPITGIHVLDLGGGLAHAVASSSWNGYALVRPGDDPEVERPAPWISVGAEDATIGEGTGGTVDITLSEAAPTDVEVTWAVEGGAPATATVPAGQTGVSVPVSVTDDELDEDDEELAVHVLAVSDGVGIGRRVAVVTVEDDDDAPTLRAVPATTPEGDTSLTDVEVEVELSAVSGKDVEVLWATEDGTATSPTDHGAASGHLLIPAGETKASFHLAVVGDTEVEPHEQLEVVLTDPVHASLGTDRATVRIVDDEPLAVAVSGPEVAEGDADTEATFTVTATAPPQGTTVSVPWQVAGASATVGEDVQAAGGTLTLDGDAPAQPVTATVVGDAAAEPVEVFRLVLGAATASDGRRVVVAETGVGTILDDDPVADPGDGDDEPGGDEPDEDPTPVFDFDGFFQPVDAAPAVNAVQAGRAIPVRFSLGGDHGLDVFGAGSPASHAVACDGGAPVDAIEQTVSPGASELTYDPDTDTYQYVWKTEKGWKGQCRQLVVGFVDGTEATALFRLR